MILTPGFLLAGIMGLAREGHKGPFFVLEVAFYLCTMGYPLLFLAGTIVSTSHANRNYLVAALLAQAAPIAIPVGLFLLVMATA